MVLVVSIFSKCQEYPKQGRCQKVMFLVKLQTTLQALVRLRNIIWISYMTQFEIECRCGGPSVVTNNKKNDAAKTKNILKNTFLIRTKNTIINFNIFQRGRCIYIFQNLNFRGLI